jgi:Bacteriophage probable baseplate hub protein
MTEQPQAIYTNYDFYVPAFELRVKGQSLDRETIRDVISVSYSDSLDKLDACQITLNNWDAEQRSFKYSDPQTAPVNFDPGASIELFMGYYDRGGLTLMLRGQIVSIEPDFPAGGQPTLQLRALNQLYKLHFKQETQVFENKTDSQIAQAVIDKIAQDQSRRRSAGGQAALNLELVMRPANRAIETPHEYIVLNNEYPIIFLMERARHNGYDMYIEEVAENGRTTSKLHFHPPDRGIPQIYELTYGRTLIGFKPTLRTKNQVAKVTVRGWNPRQTREPIVGEATWDDLDIRGLPGVDDMAAVDSALAGSEEIVADEPIYSQDEARQKARDHLTRLAKDLVTGAGSTVGLPELRAGRPIYIRGLGSRFSGRYLITSTTHTIGDSGYTTQFEARMEELR